MGNLASKPDFSVTMSGVSSSGRALLNAITANEIWGDTSLQYLFGSSDALTLDTEFDTSFHDFFSGTPDTTFAFSQVALNAFARIDAVSMLDFTQTSSTSAADLVLVSADNNPNSSTEGFFEFPGTSFRGSSTTDSWQLGAFNSAMDTLLTAPEQGGGICQLDGAARDRALARPQAYAQGNERDAGARRGRQVHGQ